jgi:hypothetical protein
MRFSLIAVVATLVLAGGSLATPSSVFARDGSNRFGSPSRAIISNSGIYRSDNYRHGRGDFRHHWYGRWNYGVDSCWQWSVDDDRYEWVCGNDE